MHLRRDFRFEDEGDIVVIGMNMLGIFNQGLGNMWSSILFDYEDVSRRRGPL